ncbi:MAG: hypothetical protein WCW01_05680 [Gammaproteobacteria bacterium]
MFKPKQSPLEIKILQEENRKLIATVKSLQTTTVISITLLIIIIAILIYREYCNGQTKKTLSERNNLLDVDNAKLKGRIDILRISLEREQQINTNQEKLVEGNCTLQKKTEFLRKENIDLHQSLTNQIVFLQQQIKTIPKELAQQNSDLQRGIQVLQQSAKELIGKITTLEEEIKINHGELTQQNHTLVTDIEHLRNESKDLRARYTDISNQLEALRTKITNATGVVAQALEQVGTFKNLAMKCQRKKVAELPEMQRSSTEAERLLQTLKSQLD